MMRLLVNPRTFTKKQAPRLHARMRARLRTQMDTTTHVERAKV